MSCLVDTNVLLRWVNDRHPENPVAVGAVDQLRLNGETMFVTPQNLIEFWNVSTRPVDRNGLGLSPAEALAALDRVEAFYALAEDAPQVYPMWRRLVGEAGVRGVQVHDARLAAVMRVNGIARILTFNTADFTRYTGIEALHPRDVTPPRRRPSRTASPSRSLYRRKAFSASSDASRVINTLMPAASNERA